MDSNFISLIFIDFYHSVFFGVIKFLLVIYSLVIIADIVLMVILRGFGKDFRMMMRGMNVPSKKTTRKKWNKIRRRMESGDAAQYKLAILEADGLVDWILTLMGYKGENMPEKLSQMSKVHFEDGESLEKAHQIRNNIVHSREFSMSREQAEEIVGIYEKFLEHFELI